ncbi:MAG: hypothetical protein H7141_12295 [Burkholderiales bacterium]|nr:hypothetical protein [Bacteroidia bacterium]
MNFEKKKQLLNFLSTDDWAPALNQKYKNFNPKDDFFAFQEKLNSVFMEFKEEFQVNELLENSNIYISRLIYDLNTCINSLNSYLENEMNFYSNSGFQNDITVIDAIGLIKENEKYELSFVESMIKKQIDLANDVLDYLEINKISLTSKSTENIKIVNEETTSNQKNTLPYQKPVFRGKKLDLIMMHMSLQSAGVIEFKTRRDLELFLEHNFKYVHGKQENDITAVGTEISEIYLPFKEHDKIGIKTINEKRNNFFDKLKDKVKQVNFISDNGANPWD